MFTNNLLDNVRLCSNPRILYNLNSRKHSTRSSSAVEVNELQSTIVENADELSGNAIVGILQVAISHADLIKVSA